MFCWSCGHENPGTHKFCGECGKSLFKPEQVVHEITSAKSYVREKEITTPDTTFVVREPEQPKPANPLIEESHVVHENPLAAVTESHPTASVTLPTPIRDHIPNRINGPSFLGLSDDPSRSYEASYFLDEEPENSSPWRGYLLLAAIVVISLLIIRNWQDVRAIAGDYAQRLGISDAPKHPAGPQRVTAGNDASQITPDAAASEGKSTTPSEDKPATADKSKSTQTAKLEKPQSDNSAAAEPAPEDASKPAPPKEKPAPPPINSKLEEAQKYLQGRGVPQDCNRGLNLLRAAANQPNPRARIQMAALFASGHCVTEDLPQAYNWFSKAQELDPQNRLIERNLNALWSRMSDKERRKVLR